MRRLRQALKRAYWLRKHTEGKDEEGNTYHEYGAPQEFQAIIRHAAGRENVAQYGERTSYTLKMQYEGGIDISIGDGICVYADKEEDPDYIVKSTKGLTQDAFRVAELEAV